MSGDAGLSLPFQNYNYFLIFFGAMDAAVVARGEGYGARLQAVSGLGGE